MQIDLFTIYVLCAAVLGVASAMAFGESLFNLRHQKVLRIWSLAYVALLAGSMLVVWRAELPPVLGAGLSNVLIFVGYGLMVAGISAIGGQPVRAPLGPIACGIVLWLWAGPDLPLPLWHAMAALVIACIQFAGVAALLSPSLASLRSRPIAIAIFVIHGMVYMGRVIAMPLLDPATDAFALQVLSVLTMGEGVLYAVAAPITLLAMVRDEGENRLIVAAQTDFLTGLANRRSFTQQAGERITPDGPAGVLLVFDLDHFKAVNDTFGHQTGDEILRLFAQVAESEMKPNAVIGRLGGEEFAAFVPFCDLREGERLADRLRCRFREAAGVSTQAVAVTVSVGVASSKDRDLEATMAAADRALYRAKRLGRNRVEPETLAA
ncbi:GGDEF domain-containing protein [Aureimonas flava]|uniref:diguanylate cyclase n=1 Tax=Aureimonas flava TaxID=2320271 RepID=A0A3A1WIS5_9HYPH|nr:GGDEF domain-containing protein [Aureimonas flava]RIY00136.1 GGDEF domain-containing protein [Aureimonas flava]